MKPPERDPADPRQARIVLRKQLIAEGLNDRAIGRLRTSGTLHRVRHGAYVDGPAWRECDEVGQHGLKARAVLRQARSKVVVSHLSALGEWGVPLWDLSLDDVHLTRLDQRGGRREAGVRQHLGELRDLDVLDLNGIRVTSATRTALDAVSVMDTEHALSVVDDLLHRGLTTADELSAGRAHMERWPFTLQQDLVLRLADGRMESVGESRTNYLCWRQGVPAPHPQYEIRDRSGTVIARVDFAWPKAGVFLEFDGRTKYEGRRRDGESVTEVVLREKQREDLIRELTGWRCIRLTWPDLYHPERTAQRILRTLAGPAAAAG